MMSGFAAEAPFGSESAMTMNWFARGIEVNKEREEREQREYV